ncbi:unnamed protein product [Fraxinus pennsylvanica]|uniref:Secreted protein n=1 Tax=Fraxinus pennsylvanica TaxID=56036 RepID=A0AAD2E764_9LAMI|nr:unnamed protein product [Fraxinus pennsylvanica]
MNCSRSCLRLLLGIFSLGITNRSLGGTFSPISCISPSTTHHSDLSSVFFSIDDGENLDRRRLGPESASVRAVRSWKAANWSWLRPRALLVSESIGNCCKDALLRGSKVQKGALGYDLRVVG